MRPAIRLACATGLALLFTMAASGQSNRWYDPYQKGVKAFEAKDYASTITLMQQAISADPKASANKYVEGVFRTDYFPYYYLGVAYLETRQYDKAEENFNKARNGLSRALLARLDEYEKRRVSETSIARRGGPPAPPSTAAAKPAGPSPNFEPAIEAADAALAARRYSDAVLQFEAAKKADAAEFAKTNAQARLDEAERGVSGLQHADEGRQLLSRSQLGAAKARFQLAEQELPGQKTVSDGLVAIKQREDNYRRLKAAAEQNVRGNNLRQALDDFAQAKAANSEQFVLDSLDARVKAVNEKFKEIGRPVDAEPLVALPVPAPAAKAQEPGADKVALRDALVALLKGDAQQSASILEPALANGQSSAALHAYLGVAYATQALSAVAQDDAARALRDKAMAEFRLAVKAQRDYALSPRVVSPKIVALFEQARLN